MTRNNKNPGTWGTHDGKPSITWHRPGDPARGEPEDVAEITTYDSDAARIEAFVHNMKIFSKDGALTGTTYCKAIAPRGAVININLRGPGRQQFRNSVTVDGRDFNDAYRRVVTLLADHYRVPEDTPIRARMMDTAAAFLRKSGLELVEVRYLQPEPIEVDRTRNQSTPPRSSPRRRTEAALEVASAT